MRRVVKKIIGLSPADKCSGPEASEQEHPMQRSNNSAPLLWRCLIISFAGLAFSLVFYFPGLTTSNNIPVSFPQSLAEPTSPVRVMMPVVVKYHPTPIPSFPIPLITEVLYDPAGYEPDGEWIELYNAGGVSLDLYGYKIGDQTTPGCCEGMLAFPAGAVLKPGQVIVIANKAAVFYSVYHFRPDYEMVNSDSTVPTMTRYTTWADRAVELTNSGDDLLLLNGSNQVVDAISWGSETFAFSPPISTVPEGYSLERYPAYLDTDSALDWRKQSQPQPGVVDLIPPAPTPEPVPTTPVVVPTPFGGKLLLSEFLADPVGDDDLGYEWIEIYNAGDDDLVLEDFKIGDEEQLGGSEGMLRFPTGAVIPAGESIVIANKAGAFYSLYGVNPDFEIENSLAEVPDMQPYTSWGSSSLVLVNSGDELLILDGLDEPVDTISYGSSIYFLNPSIPTAPEGSSLERFPADQDSDSAADWQVQSLPNPGIPALPTPVPPPLPTPEPILVINEIHASPDLAAGDANEDGVIDISQDEFVEIVNITGSAVDLGGWSLENASLVRHVFPSPTLIQDDCSIVIFGGGDPTGDFGGSLVQVSNPRALNLGDLSGIIRLFDGTDSQVLELIYNTEAVVGESITRSPDITGSDFVPHTSVPAAMDALFSPGTMLDGSPFPGCATEEFYRFCDRLR
jgi:hypothetical protein